MFCFQRLLLAWLVVTAAHGAAGPDWIWSSKKAVNKERVVFRRVVEVPEGAKDAELWATCDNRCRVEIDGKSVAKVDNWGQPVDMKLSDGVWTPGSREVIVRAGNDGGIAAMSLRVEWTVGKRKETLDTGADWEWSPDGESDWKPAVVVEKMGAGPWGNLFRSRMKFGGEVEMVEEETGLPQGFVCERIYEVPVASQGSWVALAALPDGSLVTSAQYKGLHRIRPGEVGGKDTVVEPVKVELKGAQGMVWHDGVLWVSVNDGGNSGIHKVTDSDGDGAFDKVERVLAVQGGGEHGPHGVQVTPDGKWLYFIAGNSTNLPEGISESRVPKCWAEDQWIERLPDPRGHARGRMAPGGWIARMSMESGEWELVAVGMRNSYDIAFDEHGELFTYDADMEWDLGAPWYRPTAIFHVLSGSDFGWRNGSGKQPFSYPDVVPPLVEIGPGSPTGLMSGEGADCPALYQKCLYALDWTYATIYAIHLEPEASGYRGRTEEFIAMPGNAFTDGCVGKDGAMYFSTGGRRTRSVLYRVSFKGEKKGGATAGRPELLELRRGLESGGDPAGFLAHEDWRIRHAARTGVERRLLGGGKVELEGDDPLDVIEGVIAWARCAGEGSPELRKELLSHLQRLDLDALDQSGKIAWLRALGLVCIRVGEPTDAERVALAKRLEPRFPNGDEAVDFELCRALAALDAPGLVARAIPWMENAPRPEPPPWSALAERNKGYGKAVLATLENGLPPRALHAAYCLRVVKSGWTPALRERYFAWFTQASKSKGGNSFHGYLTSIRKDAVEALPEEVRPRYEQAAVISPWLADLPQPKGPGRAWKVAEVVKVVDGKLDGADRKNGEQMFRAALCIGCHRYQGAGGSAGPDLSTVAGRFGIEDLARSMIDPHQEVSDQYRFEKIEMKSGGAIVGRVIAEEDGELLVAANPFDLSQTMKFKRADVKSVKPSPESPMPPGLIDRLNEKEVLDLFGYLLGGAN